MARGSFRGPGDLADGSPARGSGQSPGRGSGGRSPREAETFCPNRYKILSVYGRKFNELDSTDNNNITSTAQSLIMQLLDGERGNGVSNLLGDRGVRPLLELPLHFGNKQNSSQTVKTTNADIYSPLT